MAEDFNHVAHVAELSVTVKTEPYNGDDTGMVLLYLTSGPLNVCLPLEKPVMIEILSNIQNLIQGDDNNGED